jgi:hypothetical protein
MENLVQKLRDSGSKVRVTHYRLYRQWDEVNRKVVVKELPKWESPGLKLAEPNGGRTVVEVTTPDGETFESVAVCSTKDQFVRRVGTMKAIKRLTKHLFYDMQ